MKAARALACALALACTGALAQDPNAAFANELIVVPLAGRSMAALVNHRPQDTKFTHAIALFPGNPGQVKLSGENGEIRIGALRGNTLIRARRHFLAEGIITVVMDAPSDRWFGLFTHDFRASPRYGEDVSAVIQAVAKKYGELDWTFVGHSEGVVGAVFAARLTAPAAKRVVLVSSLTARNFQGPGLRLSDVEQLKLPVLWVHNRHDRCGSTPYSTAKAWAEDMHAPLLTVAFSKDATGDPCEARSEHGLAGAEPQTFAAILSWIRTGQPPAEVTE